MDKNDTNRGTLMIADELRVLFDDLRTDIASLKLDVMLISHDVTKLREELERLGQMRQQQQESIGIAPNTPPPWFTGE